MKKIHIPLFMVCLLTASLLATRPSHASTLFPYPGEYQVTAGQTLTIDIRLDAQLDRVNVVKLKVLYSKDLLEVTSVDTRGSFLSLWPEGPTIDAAKGTITGTGGVPRGQYVIGGRVMTIVFTARTQGTASVTFDTEYSEVLKNDGRGTPTALEAEAGTFYVVDEIVDGIVMTSPTHPDENAWYRNTSFTANWEADPQALYSYVLSTNPLENPDDFPEVFEGTATFDVVGDGAHYFIVKRKLGSEPWKIVGRRRVLIDTTPPGEITYAIGQEQNAYDGKVFLAFFALDATSGIDRFSIDEDGQATMDAASPYILKDQSKHSRIVIRAYDRAGNIRELTIEQKREVGKNLSAALWIVGALIVVSGMLLIWLRSKKKKIEEKPEQPAG